MVLPLADPCLANEEDGRRTGGVRGAGLGTPNTRISRTGIRLFARVLFVRAGAVLRIWAGGTAGI